MPRRGPRRGNWLKRIGKAARKCIRGQTSGSQRSNFDELDVTFTEEQAARMPPKRPNPLEDSFELGGKLGSGSFGNVKKTRRFASDQWAASKEITQVTNTKHLQAIEREVEILQDLDHPNIVKYYESFRMEGKKVFINMELCASDLLSFLNCLKSRMDIMYIKYILESILRGCEHMHSRRVVHRDLKPANILIADDGMIKISDFGLSRYFEPPVRGKKRRYSSTGTKYYCAPEMLMGKGDYGGEVDIWSVGCIAHDLYFREYLNQGCSHDNLAILKHIRSYCAAIKDGTKEVLARVLSETGGDRLDHDLFSALLMTNQKTRPSAEWLLEHPYFHCGTIAASPEEMSIFFHANHKKHKPKSKSKRVKKHSDV